LISRKHSVRSPRMCFVPHRAASDTIGNALTV
jgi:hypothetical protein